MDEVEAALDDTNMRRLIGLLQELRATSQLIIITHQKPTMEIADALYGVSMRGDGVTQVISQRLRATEDQPKRSTAKARKNTENGPEAGSEDQPAPTGEAPTAPADNPTDAPTTDTPMDAPVAEAALADTSVAEAALVDASVAEAASADAPVADGVSAETRVADAPVEAPVAAMRAEASIVDGPVVGAGSVEAPAGETPATVETPPGDESAD
ncbi:hypothetical protein GCM10029964_104770 [Kibdelosporangium lantanae]